MDENQRTSFRSIGPGENVADLAESMAKEVVSKGIEMGQKPEDIAELYAGAFIAAAITSVSSLASRDVERCVNTLNTILRVAGALGFKFGVSVNQVEVAGEMPGEARRDH